MYIRPWARMSLLASAGAVCLGAGQGFAPAAAQDQGLADIVVTARKRAESLMEVPVAVSAIGAEEIQRAGVSDLTRIAQMAPQVMLAQADSGAGASFSIRGLGTSFLDPGLDQSVVVVLDGIPVSRGNVVLMGMFDLAQVEVLKGPQALFFGKNSPAGVVSLSSASPTDTFEGYVRLGYEFEAREPYLEAAVSGPLTETLKARLAVRGSTMRGWMRNVAQPAASPLPPEFVTYFPLSAGAGHKHGPGTDELMGRGTIVWEPSSDFDATLKLSYGHREDNGTTTQQYCPGGTDTRPVSIGGAPDPFNDCKFDNRLASVGVPTEFLGNGWEHMRSDGKPYSKMDTLLTTLNMNYHLDNMTITSVTGYMDLKYRHSNNYDQTSYGLANVGLEEHTRSFTQELRLVTDYDGPVNITLGAFYEKLKRRNDTDSLIFFVGPVPAGFPGEGRYDNFFGRNEARGETISAFGQVRWDLTDTLELAGGVRWTDETRKQYAQHLFVHPYVLGPTALGDLLPVGTIVDGKFEDTNWSPEFTLTYKPQPGMMAYAAYKTGYKSGGFPSLSLLKYNADGSVPSGADFAFAPEKAKGFEAGVKAELFDNRVRIQAAAYSFKYSGLQQSVFNPPTFSFLIKNAASARIKGIELAGDWMATPELRLNAAVAYNRARYLSYPNAGCYTAQTAAQGCNVLVDNAGTPNDPTDDVFAQDLGGRRLPRAPLWNIQVGASYDTLISNGLMLGLNGDMNYSSSYATQETQPPFAVQGSFALFNAGVRLYTEDSRYELAVIGRNLANKYYVQLSTATTFGLEQGQLHAATPRPREIRVQGTYRF